MKKILITTSSFGEEGLTKLQDAGYQPMLNPLKRKLSEEEVTELLRQHQPLGMIAGVEPLTRSALNDAHGLRVISRCGIGLDSVDLEAAQEQGIIVTNTPDAPTIPVAELTLGLILALLRGITTSNAGICMGEWSRPMGQLLHGKTVGIIGCGRIGSYVARLLSSFGCCLIGYDPHLASSSPINLVELETLLAESDIITLHIPYLQETHHLFDANRLQSMKKGSFLVNAARGGLIDEQALFSCLTSGHLAGAALDCFEVEPYTGPLKDLGNVVLSGHIGSYAREGRAIMEEQAVENLLKQLNMLQGHKQ